MSSRATRAEAVELQRRIRAAYDAALARDPKKFSGLAVDKAVGATGRWLTKILNAGSGKAPDPIFLWRFCDYLNIPHESIFDVDRVFQTFDGSKRPPRPLQRKGRAALKFGLWAAETGRLGEDPRAVLSVQEALGDADPELSSDQCLELFFMARGLRRAADDALDRARNGGTDPARQEPMRSGISGTRSTDRRRKRRELAPK